MRMCAIAMCRCKASWDSSYCRWHVRANKMIVSIVCLAGGVLLGWFFSGVAIQIIKKVAQ